MGSGRQHTQELSVPFLITNARLQWKVDMDTDGNLLLQLQDPATGVWTTRHRFQRDGDLDVHGLQSDGVVF
jgi:hypothetical protein